MPTQMSPKADLQLKSGLHYQSMSEERRGNRNRYDTDQVTDEGEIDYDLEELEFEASKFTGRARI